MRICLKLNESQNTQLDLIIVSVHCCQTIPACNIRSSSGENSKSQFKKIKKHLLENKTLTVGRRRRRGSLCSKVTAAEYSNESVKPIKVSADIDTSQTLILAKSIYHESV